MKRGSKNDKGKFSRNEKLRKLYKGPKWNLIISCRKKNETWRNGTRIVKRKTIQHWLFQIPGNRTSSLLNSHMTQFDFQLETLNDKNANVSQSVGELFS